MSSYIGTILTTIKLHFRRIFQYSILGCCLIQSMGRTFQLTLKAIMNFPTSMVHGLFALEHPSSACASLWVPDHARSVLFFSASYLCTCVHGCFQFSSPSHSAKVSLHCSSCLRSSFTPCSVGTCSSVSHPVFFLGCTTQFFLSFLSTDYSSWGTESQCLKSSLQPGMSSNTRSKFLWFMTASIPAQFTCPVLYHRNRIQEPFLLCPCFMLDIFALAMSTIVGMELLI